MTDSEERFEGRYDLIANRLKQGLQHIADRFPSPELGFIEAYERGQLEVHVHIFGRLPVHKGECCALFQRFEGGYSTDLDPSNSPTLLTTCVSSTGESKQDKQRGAVFVDVPKLIEDPKRVESKSATRSLVWLRGIEKCACLCADAPSDIWEDRLSLGVLPLGFEDREQGSTGSANRGSVVEENELPRDMVKGRSETIENIPNNSGQEWWDWVQFAHDDHTVVFGLRLEIGTKTVWLGIDESLRESVEAAKIHLCSADFRPRGV